VQVTPTQRKTRFRLLARLYRVGFSPTGSQGKVSATPPFSHPPFAGLTWREPLISSVTGWPTSFGGGGVDDFSRPGHISSCIIESPTSEDVGHPAKALVPFSVTEFRGLAWVAWAGGARYEGSLPVRTSVGRRPRTKSDPGGSNSAHATHLHPHETDEPKTALARCVSWESRSISSRCWGLSPAGG
jgi:hypothetical protein